MLYMVSSGLITVWLFWTGATLWQEAVAAEPARGVRNGGPQFRVVGRRREQRAV